jgi:hypothetical protein
MAIIEGTSHSNFVKIRPEEIADYLASDFSSNFTDFVADMLTATSMQVGGTVNDTPNQPSTLGVKGLIDASAYWTARTNMADPKYFHGGSGLTSNLAIAYGGWNSGSAIPVATTERFNNSTNAWTITSAVLSGNKAEFLGATLTTDAVVSSGGFNGVGSSAVNTTDQYSDALNTWSAKAANSVLTSRLFSCASLTSDTYIMYGGLNNASDFTLNGRFSSSANSWTSRAALNAGRDAGGNGFSFTTDLVLAASGSNGVGYALNTELYFDSSNYWTIRTAVNPLRNNLAVMSLTSDLGLLATGNNGSVGTPFVDRYSLSSNIWVSKPQTGLNYTASGATLTSNSGLVFGGYNAAAPSTGLSINNQYTDNQIALLSGTALISNQINNTPAVPDSTAVQQVLTKTITTTIPSRILVSGVYSQLNPVQVPTVDISPDGGVTWSITGKAFDTTINTSALSGTDLRLRFNLPRLTGFALRPGDLVQANTWTVMASLPFGNTENAGSQMTSDLSINVGGNNGVVLANNYRFSNSGNAWTPRTSLPSSMYAGGQATLTADLSLSFSGYNTTFSTTSNRYSDSAGSWIGRSSSVAVYGVGGTCLTSDLILEFGGNNGVAINACEKYSDSLNTWAYRTVFSLLRWYVSIGCSTLTSDTCLAVGGNVSGTLYNNVDRYSDSANTWTARNTFPLTLDSSNCSSLTSDSVLVFGGRAPTTATIVSFSARYSDSVNSFITRSLTSVAREWGASMSMTSNMCLYAGGANSGGYPTTTERYNDGETYLKGFGVKYL